ncbi:MOSC domain-containing protein [Glaciecola sp. MH2013]|uniref:MOSC domain-containing protein n=1 Tax=Glaciecola sp. MH2013 TaxID=2785524 RepID=UPI00189DDDAA|nr:MOSC domain-containing protein [Glaciecola sp. MH2013]MBF7074142.1 MOSC domain-containing protein [Glaciecola sp. MH2013]
MFIESLFAGKPQPFGPRKSPSSIIKSPHSMLTIVEDGAIEDEQGNKKLHGGPEMALHQYSQQDYLALQHAFPEIREQLVPGSIGENISAPEMNNDNVFIGDTYEIGDVVLQVNSPRSPCVKINQRFGVKNIDTYIGKHGLTGWYFRVIESGTIKVNDPIKLVHRLKSSKSVKEIVRLVRDKDACPTERLIASNIPALADEWVRKLRK